MAYAAFQELATRISHRNTGRYSDDPVADRIMLRVAADENLHMMFYRDIVAAALQADPSAAVEAISEEVIGFDMPGVVSKASLGKALQMAQAGIYDLRIHHDEILWPLLRHWKLFQLEGLRPQADQARDRLAAHLAKTDRLASRFEAKRMRAAEAQERARPDLLTREGVWMMLDFCWAGAGQGRGVRARGAGRGVLDAEVRQRQQP